jgi:hypothetical protein
VELHENSELSPVGRSESRGHVGTSDCFSSISLKGRTLWSGVLHETKSTDVLKYFSYISIVIASICISFITLSFSFHFYFISYSSST